MKKLLSYMKGYGRECVLGPLFKLLEATLELFVPLVIARLIDVGIAAGDRGACVRACLLLALLGLVGLAFSVTAQYFAARAAVGFVARLKHALFSHLTRLSYAEADRLGVSTMITRMTSDMNQIQNGVNLTLRLLLRSPFVVFGAMVMAFTIDARAALVFVAAIPLLALVVFGIMLVSIPLYKKVQSSLDRVTKDTRENLNGVRVLRAFCREEEEIRAFRADNEALSASQRFVGRISALMNPLTYVLVNLAVAVLIYTGAVRVEAGILTQGAVIALYNYMSQILVELIKMANLIISLTKAVACGNRVADVLALPTGMPAVPGVSRGVQNDDAVRFTHASLRYHEGGEDALSDVSLSVRRGETVGVIGGTGSGKSSLVQLIPRFYDVTDGSVTVDGVDVRAWDAHALRARIGIVPQKATLFCGTIRDNLRWGSEAATDAEIAAALEIAQAAEIVAGKPGGLDFRLEQGGRNLSGGQRQRLSIARALVRRPEILILDDSASALDFATDAALRAALRTLKDTTVFIVSQRTSSIAHADKIVVLDDGRAVDCGRHEELLSRCAVYREIFDSQFKKEADAK